MRRRSRDSQRSWGSACPNMVISPFTRKHYVSHIPMDHTAIIKFVENRFIGSSAHLTARDAAQPESARLLRLHRQAVGYAAHAACTGAATSLGYNPCLPQSMGP